MKRYGIIYKIENKINGKIYIGQTTKSFKERYNNDVAKFTHNQHLKDSIEKYGIKNFEITEEFDIAYSMEELNKKENHYINLYKSTDRKFGYNKKTGGANGRHNEETKKKISLSKQGKTLSEETRKKISLSKQGENNHFYGKTNKWGHHSEETRRKMSLSKQGKTLSEETRRKLSLANQGKTHSEKTKRKMSLARQGKTLSEETRRKLSLAKQGENHPFYGKTLSEETRKKMSLSKQGENHPQAKQCVIIIDDVVETKSTRRELISHIEKKYDIRGVQNWFNPPRIIPKKFQSRVTLVQIGDRIIHDTRKK